jgi:hypothetical protein
MSEVIKPLRTNSTVCERDQSRLIAPYELTIQEMQEELERRGLQVIVFTYYGRKVFAEISERYIAKNLKKNGGIVSKVLWGKNTINTEDLKYLAQVLKKHPEEYEVFNMIKIGQYKHRLWEQLKVMCNID